MLNNAWFDRATGTEPVEESVATWHKGMGHLAPGVETIHDAIHRHDPGGVTVALNEAADRGADYSTFNFFRQPDPNLVNEMAKAVPEPFGHATQEWVETSTDYQWGTRIDQAALFQAVSIWHGELLDRRYPVPTFTWVSFSVTDSAFHEGGPHSEIARASLRDTDARLGELLATIDERGVRDETAVLVVADHGMEETAESLGGSWGPALRTAGIEHRDEGSGFLYVGVS